MTAGSYVGRFAPSPTGPLHFGSLLAACASYLEARRHNGSWILRIEDIDPPREQDGASDDILRVLDAYGFEWDGEAVMQSRSDKQHREALVSLSAHTYECDCSRRKLASQPVGELGVVYPGTCRDRDLAPGDTATRIRVGDAVSQFDDELQGQQAMDLARESGDFVIRRRDDLIAYHLAVVVDDHLSGVTHIVRGIDLLSSTHRQVFLQSRLGASTPTYAHIPVAVHPNGDKLSKLTGAPGLDGDDAAAELAHALRVLRQMPPQGLEDATVDDIWAWALEHWDMSRLAGLRNVPA
ncbi:MAG: tRNA glutamyl-Q(34) synthetase GluQRS [Pseudomonadota bacterium]